MRLSLSGRVVVASDDAYDGTRDWEIGPHFELVGVFSLTDLIRAALPTSERTRWPTEQMTLAAQMDLYEQATRKHLWSASKEYAVTHCDGMFEFWPHISAETMERLPAPVRLPPSTKGSHPRGPDSAGGSE